MMHFIQIFSISLMLTALMSSAMATNRLVYYRPLTVELQGVVQVKTLPGPPNYDDIKKGDEPETYGYLILKHPIDVDVNPNVSDNSGGFNELERNISIIQLVVAHDKDWRFVKTGKQVQVIGKLFHSFTGHHHEKILLMIDKISARRLPATMGS